MIGKTDWTQYLHDIRKREIDMVFSLLPQKRFTSALEIGAGDGYQTTLLAPHIDKLISSDLNFKRIKESLKMPSVEYKTLDADAIEGTFKPKTFDLIFSSNVLEHVRDPLKFLKVTQPMLTDDGYAVHIIPSRLIKIFYLLFYYPNLALLALDRILGKLKGQPIFRGNSADLENNINAKNNTEIPGRLKRFLVPTPHGNFSSHWEEFKAFGRVSWTNMVRKAGYSVVQYSKGPSFTGYGFGLNSLRKVVESLGGSSEHIFILRKTSPFEEVARTYTNAFLPRGSDYEKEKFIEDWRKKEKSARHFINDFKKDVGDPQGKKVLDVGFGNGIMLLEFAKTGAEVYGLETENTLMDLAVKKFKDNKLKSKLVIYDGKTFPFPNNTFDYAYSTSVLEHMSYPEEVLREIYRTLVPGGRFYLSFPNKYAPKESHTGLWFISWLPRPLTQYILKLSKSSPLEDWNLHFYSYFDLRKMAKKTGLMIRYDTKSPSLFKGSIKSFLAKIGIHHGALLKTVILVLEKPYE